jgi:hypothetical protein
MPTCAKPLRRRRRRENKRVILTGVAIVYALLILL